MKTQNSSEKDKDDLIGVLFAISAVTRRLAKNIITETALEVLKEEGDNTNQSKSETDDFAE